MSKIALLPKYNEEIMRLVADGKIVTEIQTHLYQKYQVVISVSSLGTRIRKCKQENAEVARAALSQQVVKTTINHTEIFEKNIVKLTQQIELAFDKKQPLVARALLDTQLRIQQQHLSLLGLDRPRTEEENDSQIIVGLLRNLGPKDD